MSNRVKVFNLNTHPLVEMFKGEEVSIEPQDYWRDRKGKIKELDIYEANDFRGQYHPTPQDGSGKMIVDAKYFKMIRIDPIDFQEPVVEELPGFKCMAPGCKHVSPSPEELEAHTTTRHAGIETLIMPEEDMRMKQSKNRGGAKIASP